MARTFYDVLGVSESATVEEIEAAYRDRLKETHPDLNSAENASEAVKTVIEARDVLTDEDKRTRYDRIGHGAYVSETGSPANEPTREPKATGTRSESATASRQPPEDDRDVDDFTDQREHANADPGGWDRMRDDRHSGEHVAEGEGVAWVNEAGYAVRQPADSSTRNWWRLLPDRQSMVLLLAGVVCYPALVISSVYPPFPLVVNLVVAACTLLIVVYIASIPAVGAPSFGFWSLVSGAVVTTGGLDPVVALFVLTVTWVPFGLSLAVFTLVRP